MDKMLYIAASGAKQDLHAVSVRANNLANAQTTGFRAQLEQARSMPAYGEGLPSRVFAMTENPSNNYEMGALQTTGRELDIAVKGMGFIAVQDAEGGEAYTRAGNLNVNQNGFLQDVKGHLVMGDNGPIEFPDIYKKMTISEDGTILIQPQGAPESVQEVVGRIKLVRPEHTDIERGLDGYFRRKDGENAQADATVSILSGALEGSNVNPIDEMVNMISLQRHYEMQVKMMKQADDLVTSANNMLRIL